MEAQIREELNSYTKTEIYQKLEQEYVDKQSSIARLKVFSKRDKKRIGEIDEILHELEKQPTETEVKAQILAKIRGTKEAEAKQAHAEKTAALNQELTEVQSKINQLESVDESAAFKAMSACTKQYVETFMSTYKNDKYNYKNEVHPKQTSLDEGFALRFLKAYKNYKNAYDVALWSEPSQNKTYASSVVIWFIVSTLFFIWSLFMDGVFFKEIISTFGYIGYAFTFNDLLTAAKLSHRIDKIKEQQNVKPASKWVRLALIIFLVACMVASCVVMIQTLKRRIFIGILGLILGVVAGFFVIAAIAGLIEGIISDNAPKSPNERALENGKTHMLHIVKRAEKVCKANREIGDTLADASSIHALTSLLQSPLTNKELIELKDELYSDEIIKKFAAEDKSGEELKALKNRLGVCSAKLETEKNKLAELLKSIGENKYEKEVQAKFAERAAGPNEDSLKRERQTLMDSVNRTENEIKETEKASLNTAKKLQATEAIFTQKVDSKMLGRLDNAIALGFAANDGAPSKLITLEHYKTPVIVTYEKSAEENNGAELSGIEALLYHMFWGCVYNSMRETRFNLIDEAALFSNLFYRPDINSAKQSGYINYAATAADTTSIIAKIINEKSSLTGKIDDYNKVCINEMRSIIQYDILVIAGNSKLLNEKDFVRILNNTENWGVIPVLILHDEVFQGLKDCKFVELAKKNDTIYRLNPGSFKDKFIVEANYITKM